MNCLIVWFISESACLILCLEEISSNLELSYGSCIRLDPWVVIACINPHLRHTGFIDSHSIMWRNNLALNREISVSMVPSQCSALYCSKGPKALKTKLQLYLQSTSGPGKPARLMAMPMKSLFYVMLNVWSPWNLFCKSHSNFLCSGSEHNSEHWVYPLLEHFCVHFRSVVQFSLWIWK